MLLACSGIAERHHLRLPDPIDRQFCPATDRGNRGILEHHSGTDSGTDIPLTFQPPQRRQQARAPGKHQRRFGAALVEHGDRIEWPGRPPVEVARRVDDGQRRRRIDPGAPLDQHRPARRRRQPFVGQPERCRPFAADQQLGRSLRIQQRQHLGRPGLNRQKGRVADPHRSPATQRGDGGSEQRGHSDSSTTSGTWSDGRSQFRHGSSTRCAVACGARLGLAHRWSSRRPRSLAAQSCAR